MRKLILLIYGFLWIVNTKAQTVVVPDVWINEVHYNNTGNDTLNGFEIAGPGTTNLACYEVFLYDGTSGTLYRTDTLTSVINTQQAGYGTVWFALPQGAFQNVNIGGIALVYAPQATNCGTSNVDTVLQFLSYGGTFTAIDGRLQGFTSTDIGVAESGSTAVGTSLQLGGTGMKYSDFTWQTSLNNTYGAVNLNQTFVNADPIVQFVQFPSTSFSEGAGTVGVAITITNPNANPTSVDVNVLPGGTAHVGADFNYSPITVTFPGNSSITQIVSIALIDDHIPNGDKFFTFKLAFPTNNATVGTNDQLVVNIIDDDTLKLNVSPTIETQYEFIGSVNVQVTLTGTSDSATSVDLKLVPAGTSAVDGVDFYFNDTTVTWAAGTSGTINVSVPIINNPFFEPARTIELKITDQTNRAFIFDSTFTLTINANTNQVACSDLFFSQYIEGSGSNQAIQLFNPTTSSLNLNQYQILKSANGGATITSFPLTGSIAAQGVYVAANPLASAAITGVANTLSSFFNFDGIEALALVHLTDTIDIIGQLYVNPGAGGWAVDTGTTENHTLIRNYYIYSGDTLWNSAQLGWQAYATNMTDSLGLHHIAPCGTPAPATIQFIVLSDTVFDTAAVIPVVIRVDNPNSNPVTYIAGHNDIASTAGLGIDWSFVNQQFTHNQGVFYDTVYIDVIPNTLVQPTVKAVLGFYAVSGGIEIPDTSYTLYITNENLLAVSFLGAGFSYQKDTSLVEIKITLSGYVSVPVSANVTLAPGSAINGVDFTFNDTTVTFPAFSIDTQGVWVRINSSIPPGPNKQANFNLSNPTGGALIGISAYTLTIINVDTSTGIAAIDFDAPLTIFPNPVTDELNILTETDLSGVEITDIAGNILISQGKLVAGKNSINVSRLPAGMYFISLKSSDRLLSKRFVKL